MWIRIQDPENVHMDKDPDPGKILPVINLINLFLP